MEIPSDWILSPKDKITLSLPVVLNQKVEELSKQLEVTKSLLYMLGMAMIIKLIQEGTTTA
jgi:hypothetical protein